MLKPSFSHLPIPVLLTILATSLLPAAHAQILLTESFDDSNGGSRWSALSAGTGDTLADFSFDYSTLGIPPAPNSADTTLGMALTANRTAGMPGGISVTPDDFWVYGDFSMTFDAWLNYRGPLGSMMPESHRFATFGYGTNGQDSEWTGNMAPGAVLFAMSNNGGVPDDFRLISNSTDATDLEFLAASRDHSAAAYQTLFPAQTAPTAQETLDPDSQTGATQAGEAGFAWHQVEVRKQGTTITWSINGNPILSKDTTGILTEDHKIFFGISDAMGMPQTGSHPDFNAFIVDNVVVQAIPDDRTVVESFRIDLWDAQSINPYISDDHGIFSNDLVPGQSNDASRGYNVPISVVSVQGFNNTTREGNLQLEADLTTWNSNNTMVNPQGVQFRFTIHADGQSSNPTGNGFLNGSYNGQLGIDDILPTETYPTLEQDESVIISIRDLETLSAPPGHSVRFNRIEYIISAGSRPFLSVSMVSPQVIKVDWNDNDPGDAHIGSSGPGGMTLNFSIVENTSEAPVHLQATEIATEQNAAVELPNFAQLQLGGIPTILQNWEVATDTPEFFAVQPSIDAQGTLSYTANGVVGSGSLRIRALDDMGFTPWTTVNLKTVATDITGTLPLHPDTFDSLGNLMLGSTTTVEINTTNGIIQDNSTFLPVMTSAQLLVENNGRIWRVFCVDRMSSYSTSTILPVTGQYGLALISRGRLFLATNLSFNGEDGINGQSSDTFDVPAGNGTDATDGGNIALIGNHRVNINGTISVNGGNGGDGGDAYEDMLHPTAWPDRGTGGSGGQGGCIIVSGYPVYITQPASVRGGDGGAGGVAIGSLGDSDGAAGPGGDGGCVIICRGNSNEFPAPDLDGGTGNPNGGQGMLTMTAQGAYFLGELADFRRQYGMALDGSDDDADWSADGIPNIHHYLFALGDPSLKPTPEVMHGRIPTVERSQNGYELSYVLPLASSILGIEVQQSTNLQSWAPLDDTGANINRGDFGSNHTSTRLSWNNLPNPSIFYRVNFSDTTLNVFADP